MALLTFQSQILAAPLLTLVCLPFSVSKYCDSVAGSMEALKLHTHLHSLTVSVLKSTFFELIDVIMNLCN